MLFSGFFVVFWFSPAHEPWALRPLESPADPATGDDSSGRMIYGSWAGKRGGPDPRGDTNYLLTGLCSCARLSGMAAGTERSKRPGGWIYAMRCSLTSPPKAAGSGVWAEKARVQGSRSKAGRIRPYPTQSNLWVGRQAGSPSPLQPEFRTQKSKARRRKDGQDACPTLVLSFRLSPAESRDVRLYSSGGRTGRISGRRGSTDPGVE